MEQEDQTQFQIQNRPVQIILQCSQIHVRIQKLSSHEMDSLTLEQIQKIKGMQIKQIDFICDEEPREYEFKIIEQIINLIRAQNEILHFQIQNCEWNKELQQFIQNADKFKASLKIKFQDDEWFSQISDLNIYKQWSDITFLSNSLNIQIIESGIYLQLTRRSFINSLLTQQKLKELASYRPQREFNITFQQNLEDQEVLNLIDSIICFQLKRVVFYKLLTLERQNQAYDNGYHLVLEEDISQQLVQKLFQQYKIISLYSSIKKAVDQQILLQQESLHSFKWYPDSKYGTLSLEQIKDYFQLATNHPQLKEIQISSYIDYQKYTHLKLQAQLIELNTLQELTNNLAELNSNISIEILISCKNEGVFSSEKVISSEDQHLLSNLVQLSKQFQKGFHLNINENFVLKTLPSQAEICNKIENLDLCQLNLSQIKKIKIEISENNLQKLFEFFQKLLEENLELYSIEIQTLAQNYSYSCYYFNSQSKKDESLKLFQLLKQIQVQSLQQIQHLNIFDVQNGPQIYFNLEKSELSIVVDKCTKNYEFTIQFLQNLIPIRTNQFSSIKYSGQSQDHQLHSIIIDQLKELSYNNLINIDIHRFLNIDVQNKMIKFEKLKDYTQHINYLNQNVTSVQVAEKLIISKTSLKPKKNTIESLIGFLLEKELKIKSVDLISLKYKFDISQVLSILQFLFQKFPKFSISNFQHKFLQFDSESKSIVTHLFNNNEYFKQTFAQFTKIYLKMNNITDKANIEILVLINQNSHLKELVLNVQKFDQIDLVSKIQFKSFQFDNMLIQGLNFKIFFEKKTKTLKMEANSMQVIQHFLMNNTAQNQDLFTSVEVIELLDLSHSNSNDYLSFNHFLIKPFNVKSLTLQVWQSLDRFLELIEYIGNLNLETLLLDLKIDVDNKYFISVNESISKILQSCLVHQKIKQYNFNFQIFQKNQNVCEISYNQNKTLCLKLDNFSHFQKKAQYSLRQIIDLPYQFIIGFKYTRKVFVQNFYTQDKSLINLFLQKMIQDLPFLSRVFVKNSDSFYPYINQYLKLKSYFLNLIQLLRSRNINYGLNRPEKFIDLLEYFQVLNKKSILFQDLEWDYNIITKML
ncbi:hypothetical protein ABPG74_011768 [Tetrahymena malaccensis]